MSFRDRPNVRDPGRMPAVDATGARGAIPYVPSRCDAKWAIRRDPASRRGGTAEAVECVTTNVLLPPGSWFDKLVYAGNDIFSSSRLHKPFATGNRAFERKKFLSWGLQ
jgi:hypothetical protein